MVIYNKRRRIKCRMSSMLEEDEDISISVCVPKKNDWFKAPLFSLFNRGDGDGDNKITRGIYLNSINDFERALWMYLYWMSKISPTIFRRYIKLMCEHYQCSKCRLHLVKYLKENPLVDGHEETWFIDYYLDVNKEKNPDVEFRAIIIKHEEWGLIEVRRDAYRIVL